MFKKFKLMIMILMVVLLTTSCWSRREIEDLGFILGIGISKTDEGLYSVTAQEGIGQIVGFLIQDMEIRLEFEVFVSKIPPPTKHEMDVLKFNKIAIFDNDQLKGYLDYEEAQGFNFIAENFENGLIVYECSKSTDTITVEILESTVNITPSYTNEKVGFHIQLNVSGNLAERVSPTNRILQLDMAVVQEQLASVLEDKLRKSVSRAQEDFQVDYFNLSKYFYRKYPSQFKELQDDWNAVFSSADISIQVDTSIIHSSLNLNNGRM